VLNVRNLLGEPPQATPLADESNKLYDHCLELLREVKSLKGKLPKIFTAINDNPNDPQAIADLSQFVRETEPLPSAIRSLTEQVGQLTSSIVADRAVVQAKVGHQYEVTRDLSYVLFVLGWLTGLVGQLLGVGPQA
jgi:hypothetical protein